MPLYIRDDEVDALAAKLQREINAASKTEAVRIALLHELERNHARKPLRDRIACCRRSVPRCGRPIPTST
ncbi:type II toxin-antitoxin system VapB family antitoxin [Mesorhizobium sp.]|uniref:type II toxin-antitoxin system VapB family antitoxin n=1 Tax=Mesorhizobium sp. TaxID=1871066 RepID=UPI0026CA782B